jgi:DUF4097 and DUF4098 domain-containing protein YvlB
MTSWDFPAADPIDLHIDIPAGNVTVTAAATQTATVTVAPCAAGRRGAEFLAATRVEFDHGVLSVIAPDRRGVHRGASLDVTVEVPSGSAGELVTASADVRCGGELRSLVIRTASGDVAAEQVTGPVQVHTASGDVRLGHVGELQAETASGDVQVQTSAGDVCVRTASGDVKVGSVTAGRTDITSASGDVTVDVGAGIGVYLDLSTLSGSATSDLMATADDHDPAVTLRCRTISGDVRVGRAS